MFQCVNGKISVCLQESQHLGVISGRRGSRRAAHVMALQRQSHQYLGQRAGPCSRRKSGPTAALSLTPEGHCVEKWIKSSTIKNV